MFCDNLISLRKLNGLSQEELAEQLNVSRQIGRASCRERV